MVYNKANQFTGTAFIMFNNIDDIELALECAHCQKILNSVFKIFRSSKEQFFKFCDVAAVANLSVRCESENSNSVPTIESNDQLENVQHKGIDQFNSTHLIYVKGIPWSATKQSIVYFFDGIHILNGVNGIHFIIENTKSNNAFVQLASANDYQLAIKRRMKPWGYSSVTGKISSEESNAHRKLFR